MGALKALLKRTDPDGKEMFANLSEFAKAIMDIDKPDDKLDQYKRHKSIIAFLSQIDSRERKCSDDFKETIIKAVEHRLSEYPNQIVNNEVKEFVKIIEFLKREKTYKLKRQDPDIEFEKLKRCAENAKSHFIIANKTAETVLHDNSDEDSNGEISEIEKILLKSIGLFIGKDGGFHEESNGVNVYDFKPDTRYYFFLPDEEECIRFWRDLFVLVSGKGKRKNPCGESPSMNEIDDAFIKISGNYITTYERPDEAGAVPLVVYDAFEGNPSGFILSYHSRLRVSVAELSHEDLSMWMKKVFFRISQLTNLQEKIIGWEKAKPIALSQFSQFVER